MEDIISSVEYIKNGVVDKEVTSKIEKYLRYILILLVIIQVFSISEFEFVLKMMPSVKWIGIAGMSICNLLICSFYYKLSFIEEDFKTYSKLLLVAILIDFVVSVIQVDDSIATLLKLPVAIIGIFAIRYQCTAFSNLVLKHNTELYINWTNLWKWHKWIYLTMIVSIVVIFIPSITAILLLGVVIAQLVVTVLEIWYLYKTYKYFKELSMDQVEIC